MNENTLAKRYASALAELATEQNALETVHGELNAFAEVMEATPALADKLTNPTEEESVHKALVSTYVEQVSVSPLTSNFLNLLVDKRRIGLIEGMVDAFNEDVEARSGRLTVQIQTPKELTATHSKQLNAALAKATGKEIQLDVQLEPDLLGGMVVQIGSLMMDYSLRSRINRLHAHLRG
ncbi:MAG: ATP synthase F1 subunit delta [Magnetococcales bacterium]|nr:ATP synthase F1 subunit delta [Magnetococcales bacterium]